MKKLRELILTLTSIKALQSFHLDAKARENLTIKIDIGEVLSVKGIGDSVVEIKFETGTLVLDFNLHDMKRIQWEVE